ncbi:MAG: aminopeptidase N [Pikeienuella sp.]
MRPDETPARNDKTIRLSDYTAPAWLVEETHLTFDLHPTATRVKATISFVRNPAQSGPADLKLDGAEMALISAKVDGNAVDPLTNAEGLTVPAANLPSDRFTWECETEINPQANTALEGLYMSNGMYCTQCEAEGFRKITYYPDRPDVMTKFHVRIESDLPVLLSNGDPVARGDGFAEWNDPWPKPAYLFALVAGDLVSHDDTFTTMSGREVKLGIYVRPGDEDKCAYAMDALKRSMRWDETEYGREYDLDHFNIVAVEDFNMGAMENKGLNIFNSKYVLASPETATDQNYALIEGIIAHEYFHNWTGNRITCRDWFQLCLKEGLTVFRDQQFSGDMRSHAVQRIADVQQLRARQFREDAGPLAHPVRPEAYVEINNFYTATVYEKGAEVIRMLHRLVGKAAYDRALTLYFDRHDGQACTIEDWLQVFEDATGRDLDQFARWYSQAGTPRVTVTEAYDGGEYRLSLTQDTRPTPGQPEKLPQVIPVAYGFLAADGTEVEAGTLELTEASQTFVFELPERPILSLFREFSAPVIVERSVTNAERAFLMAHDTDPFNKWEAARALSLDVALEMLASPAVDPSAEWADALVAMANDTALDPEFLAMMPAVPGQDEIAARLADQEEVVDPDAVFAVTERMAERAAVALSARMTTIYHEMATDAAYDPGAEQAGRRALRNAALGWISRTDGGAAARAQFAEASNMTDSLAALTVLVRRGLDGADEALAAFEKRWAADSLVMDKWYMVQALSTAPDALQKVASLANSDGFNWKNPNKFRSLIGTFAAANAVRFHSADGAGYGFFADWLIRMDDTNPQTAARVAGAFETWRRYDEARQTLIATELDRILAKPALSKDMAEIVGRIRAA